MIPAHTGDAPRAEITKTHTRLLRCALEVEDARAYWRRVTPGDPRAPGALALVAFREFWFGDKSLPRIEVLLQNFRARFDAWPEALAVLHAWPDIDPHLSALVCHWHTQLTDPLYRAFTTWLAARRAGPRPTVTRDLVVTWVGEWPDAAPWTMSTRVQFASKLLSAAHAAGLVVTTRDPRPLAAPRVPDVALAYLLHLLRGVTFAGTLTDNPYLTSVGLSSATLESRLRGNPALDFRRQGDLIDLGFRAPDLATWASSALGASP